MAEARRVRWALAIAAWSITLAGTDVARAEDPEALRLFVEGRALADQGKYTEACQLYAKSYELERAAGTTLNLGDCAEREGKLRRAWLMYNAAASEYEKTQKPTRAKFARERANAVAAKLATVVLRIPGPRIEGLTIRIGDYEVPPAAEIVERLDPGQIPILVSAPGREPFSTTATVAGGSQVVFEVPVLRPIGGSADVRGGAPAPASPRRQRSRVRLAAGAAGVGVIALGVSGALAWSADRLYDEQFRTTRCIDRPSPEPNECLPEGLAAVESARTRSDIATVLAISGGALLVTSVVLYYTAPREHVTVAPVASPHALGLAVGGRF